MFEKKLHKTKELNKKESVECCAIQFVVVSNSQLCIIWHSDDWDKR